MITFLYNVKIFHTLRNVRGLKVTLPARWFFLLPRLRLGADLSMKLRGQTIVAFEKPVLVKFI